eukprot:GILI01027419.1.p1 GENE.GILI01027419.1~~GILI01027419.1.p1  ORF type:complete len:311 (-),score=13.98 GILI01027419.1:21-920(-)
MSNTPEVRITASTMCLLLWEAAKAGPDVEGILVGKAVEWENKQLHDAGVAESRGSVAWDNRSSRICVQQALHIGSTYSFYDLSGTPDLDKLTECLRNPSEQILGWYSVRKSPPLNPSIREITVHKRLEALRQSNFDFSLYSQSSSSLEKQKAVMRACRFTSAPLLFALICPSDKSNASVSSSSVATDYRFFTTQGNSQSGLVPVQIFIENALQTVSEYSKFQPVSVLPSTPTPPDIQSLASSFSHPYLGELLDSTKSQMMTELPKIESVECQLDDQIMRNAHLREQIANLQALLHKQSR